MMTIKGKADQGIGVLSIKEVVEGRLDDLKENEVCMLVFNIIESCHMVIGSIDKCFISRAWSKEKISFKRMQEGMGHTLSRWNQHNMSSYGIWGGWQIGGTITGSSSKEMCEERKEEIMKYATMEKVFNIRGLKDLTRISPWKIWKIWWSLKK